MSNLKSIKIHSETYDKLTKRQRFNESFDEEINRVLAENQIIIDSLRRLIDVLQKMQERDTV